MVFNATYINNISAVSFIGGGNRRKPPTCHKLLTNFITCCTDYTSKVVVVCIDDHVIERNMVTNGNKSLFYSNCLWLIHNVPCKDVCFKYNTHKQISDSH